MDLENLKLHEGEDAVPDAGSMIESFRSIGYNLQTAVADIIDNSIAAKAKNIWIDFEWKGSESFITITDDGSGMTASELVNAMKPGSKNPLLERSTEDLGRFGLGLKTASFSQCRNLTVASKTSQNAINHRTWNLDYVSQTGGWKLLNYLNDINLLNRLSVLVHGTTVIWQNIDRLVSNTNIENEDDLNYFLDRIKEMEMHLQMVFHMFIEQGLLNIWIRDRKLSAWDPYLRKNTETSVLKDYELRNGIKVLPYVLPHHSKLVKEQFDNASWIKGWNAHQGFYVYRNNRMIIPGDWLGMYKQEEHYKLARIMVNVPNTVELDREWHLDIKKSNIHLPYDIRQELKRIADCTRKEAVEIYRQIGKSKRDKSKKENIPVWISHKWNGKRCYLINKDHPIIKSFVDYNIENKGRILRLLKLIEETLPLPMIIINESENLDSQNLPFEGKALSDLVQMIIDLFQSLIGQGYTQDEAIEEILRTEPFNHYPELTEHLENESI